MIEYYVKIDGIEKTYKLPDAEKDYSDKELNSLINQVIAQYFREKILNPIWEEKLKEDKHYRPIEIDCIRKDKEPTNG